jgi:hypothetical protein
VVNVRFGAKIKLWGSGISKPIPTPVLIGDGAPSLSLLIVICGETEKTVFTFPEKTGSEKKIIKSDEKAIFA